MPPKTATPILAPARIPPVRKPSTSNVGDKPDTNTNNLKGQDKGKDKDKGADGASKESMGPPPDPPKPQRILEPEMNSLVECLINATVTTGQIFRFHSEAKRLGISKHAPRPPRSLTSALAYEIGKYDQVCDALEFHISRSIAVLQRDIAREEARIRKEEEEKARARAALPQPIEDVEMSHPTDVKKTVSPSGPGSIPLTQMRRQSKMSFSTLQRNPFPLKLDLSGTGLRMDEATLSSIGNLSGLGAISSIPGMGNMGLASPITLAPKSAHPLGHGELPPEIMAALAAAGEAQAGNQHIDIDLTLDNAVQSSMDMSSDRGIGSSADKPIDLDLDYDAQMTEIFGEQPGGQQVSGSTSILGGAESSSMEILNALASGDSHQNADDLFASLDTHANTSADGLTSGPPQSASNAPAPSPSAFLADLASSHEDPPKASSTNTGEGSGSSVPFDIDQIDMTEMANMTSGFSPYDFGGTDQEGMKNMMESFFATQNASDEPGTSGIASGTAPIS